MSLPFKEPCPACDYTIEGKITGWFSKRLKLPNFCGACSQALYSRCPNCRFKFLHLTNYCPNCKHQVYRKSKSHTPIMTDQQKSSSNN